MTSYDENFYNEKKNKKKMMRMMRMIASTSTSTSTSTTSTANGLKRTRMRMRTLNTTTSSKLLIKDTRACSFPVHRFEPRATLEHPLHGATASDALQPAIIVIQEWWGCNDQIKTHAQRIANGTGAVALVPDLYRGKSTLDAAEAKHMMDDLDWALALKELASLAVSEGSGMKRKIGSIGFCMGGALSLALAATLAKNNTPLNGMICVIIDVMLKMLDLIILRWILTY
jgi:hypothetical protein